MARLLTDEEAGFGSSQPSAPTLLSDSDVGLGAGAGLLKDTDVGFSPPPPDPDKEFRDAEGRGPGYPLPHDSLERAAQDDLMTRQLLRERGNLNPPGYTPPAVDPGVIKPARSGLEKLYQKIGLMPGGEEIQPPNDTLAHQGPSALLSVPAKVATTGGRVAKAALGDLAASAMPGSEAGGNLKASLEGYPLPVERAMAENAQEDRQEHNSGWQSIAADISLGLADLAPKVAMLEAAPGTGLLKAGAAADIFGFNEKGDFSKRNAAFAAAFPFVTAGAASVTDEAIKAAVGRGFTWAEGPLAQRALHTAANQAAMDAVMAAQEAPELRKLAATDPAEFKRELAKMLGSNLAFAIPEAFKQYGAPKATEANGGNEGPKNEPPVLPETPAGPAKPPAAAAPAGPGAPGIEGGKFAKAMQDLLASEKTDEGAAPAAEASAVPVTRDLAAELEASMRGNQVAPAKPVQDWEPGEELAGVSPTVTRAEASADKSADEDLQADFYPPWASRELAAGIKRAMLQKPSEFLPFPEWKNVSPDQQRLIMASGFDIKRENGQTLIAPKLALSKRIAAVKFTDLTDTGTKTDSKAQPAEDLQARLQAEMEGNHGSQEQETERPADSASDAAVAQQSVHSEPNEPAQTVNPPAEEVKPPVRVARGLRARKVFQRETEMGGPDILSWIAENMPLLSKTQARQQWGAEKFGLNKSLWDDAPTLQRPHHNTIYSPNGSAPDRVAQAAYNDGALSAPDVNELWAAVEKASQTRSHAYEQERRQEKILQGEIDQHQKWIAAKDTGELRVKAEDLVPGDHLELQGERIKVVAKDPETGDVTLQDGSKFGQQRLAAGDSVYVEKLDAGEVLHEKGGSLHEDAPLFRLDQAESVEDQKARLEREANERQAGDQRQEVLDRSAEPLKGGTGDLGQKDLLGGGDLFSEAAAPAKQAGTLPNWLDRAIEATNYDPTKMHEGVLGAPVWLSKGLANGVLRVVRAAYHGGRAIADAIGDGLDWLREQKPAGFDEAAARAWLTDNASQNDPTLVLFQRRDELSAQLGPLITASHGPTGLTPEQKGLRYQLVKESREIQRRLNQEDDYVALLLRKADKLGEDVANARKAGDGATARLLADELQGMLDGELAQIEPARLGRVYNDLVARGEIMKSTSGPLPQGRTLGELTNWLSARKLDSPKLGIMERLSLGRRLAEEWNRGKTALAKAADTVAAGWQAFKAQWKAPPVDDDFRGVIKDWLYQKQWTGLETHRWVKEIRDQVPSKLRRMALGVWLDAGGDEALLQSQADLVPDKYRRVWETASKLTPDEKALGARIRTDFAQKLEDGLNVGLLKKGREDYGLPQLWDKAPEVDKPYDPADPLYKKAGSPRNATARLDPRDPFFSLERAVPSYFDGIMAKGEPRSLDVGDLVAHYNTQFHEALADRTVIKALKGVKAADGSPAVMISGAARIEPAANGGRSYFVDSSWRPREAVTKEGQLYQNVDHWALRDWKFASKTEDGNPVIVHGDFLVHPDYVRFLKNELGPSWVRDEQHGMGKVFNPLLTSASFLKASKFASATFHLATIGEHAMFHLVSPLTNGVEMDPARNPRLAQLMRAGLELGFGGPQELFSEGLASHGGIWGHVPGLGDFMHSMSDYLFKDYIPKIKVKAGMAILARNEARYKTELSAEQIYELSARQANAAFGVQPWRLMGTNKGWLDLNRLLLTAPDFLLSRSKVVGQALKPYNREQRYFLLAQAAVVYGVSRVLNQLLDGDPHWEPENALSVISKGRSYSARFLVNDIYHLISDPVSFASGRLGPLVRSGMEMFYQRDMRTGARIEVPFKTNSGTWRAAQILVKDLASWLIPVGMEGFLPGAAGREQTSMGQTALALVGVGSRKYTAQNQVANWAADFNRKSPDAKTERHQEQLDDSARGASDYRKLDALLDAGQSDQAAEEYSQLVATGHDPASITRRYSAVARPFTGNRAREADFRASLTPQQGKIYDRALDERSARWTAFQDLQGKMPAAAAAAP